MTATSSPPETLEPSEPARKHEEIDPAHDIDAKQTILWLGVSGLVVFISLWVLLQVFKVVISSERGAKIEATQPVELEALRRAEEAILRGGTRPGGTPQISIEQAMEELVRR